jgi:hypothetical protein
LHAFERVRASVGEDDAGPGDEVLDGAGDEYLAGAGHRRDTRADVHGDAAYVVTAQLDLTGVQTRSDGDWQHGTEGRRAADGACWPVEDGE